MSGECRVIHQGRSPTRSATSFAFKANLHGKCIHCPALPKRSIRGIEDQSISGSVGPINHETQIMQKVYIVWMATGSMRLAPVKTHLADHIAELEMAEEQSITFSAHSAT